MPGLFLPDFAIRLMGWSEEEQLDLERKPGPCETLL